VSRLLTVGIVLAVLATMTVLLLAAVHAVHF
jgi:Na+-translocating ferredoxin:NAD+ oxidoreductase RnfG subunit